MKQLSCLLALISGLYLLSCAGDKILPPDQSALVDDDVAASDTTYLQLRPVWGDSTQYDFNGPRDVLLGHEPLVYVADTGNDRIVMLDLAGNILGISQPVENPVALTQDTKLNLIIATDSNRLYRINLTANNHQIATAPVELVFEEVDNPDRRYTGVTALILPVQNQSVISYYVTCTGPRIRDNQILVFPEDFDVRVPSQIPMEPNGLGILSVASPSSITAISNFSNEFIFTMIGQNSFKTQWIRAGDVGYVPRLNPALGNFDILVPGKFSAPEDVTVDLEFNIYVIDSELDSLFKFSSSGEELQSFGRTGSGVKQFNNPNGIAIFNKTLYVADTGNNRIVRFKLSTDIEQ